MGVYLARKVQGSNDEARNDLDEEPVGNREELQVSLSSNHVPVVIQSRLRAGEVGGWVGGWMGDLVGGWMEYSSFEPPLPPLSNPPTHLP